MNLTGEILDEFKQLTGKDVKSFINAALNFLNTDYGKISAYYNGKGDNPGSQSYQNFQDLKDERDRIFAVVEQQVTKLRNTKWWIFIQQLEDIDSNLNTLDSINKWSRSSLKTVGYDQSTQLQYALKSGQTLERVAQDILGTANPLDDWYNIAVDNHLTEEDYTPDGDNTVLLGFDQVNRGISVSSIVAVMVGKAIYGIDIDANFHFDPVTQDIAVLSPDDTVTQSVNILCLLKRNQNPAAPSDGLQQELVIGSNRASLNFPIIIRQMTEAFKTDDSLKNFSIISIQVVGDSLQINFQVQTRLDETIQREVLV